MVELDGERSRVVQHLPTLKTKMEHVALNNVQLDYLARDDPQLKQMFYGTVARDRLPKSPVKTTSQGYICQHRSARSTRTTLVSGVDRGKRL